jgi:hypothetical protein
MKLNLIFVTIAITVAIGLLSTSTISLMQSANASVLRFGGHDFCHNNEVNHEGDITPKENANEGCHGSDIQGTSSGHAEQESGFTCGTLNGVTDDTHSIRTPSGNQNFNCHNND